MINGYSFYVCEESSAVVLLSVVYSVYLQLKPYTLLAGYFLALSSNLFIMYSYL